MTTEEKNKRKDISKVILKYLLDNKINFTFSDPVLQKKFTFDKKEDARKLLKYLYKNYRSYYHHLNSGYDANRKKLKNYASKIFCNYASYSCFNCEVVKNYYIYFNSYIIHR